MQMLSQDDPANALLWYAYFCKPRIQIRGRQSPMLDIVNVDLSGYRFEITDGAIVAHEQTGEKMWTDLEIARVDAARMMTDLSQVGRCG